MEIQKIDANFSVEKIKDKTLCFYDAKNFDLYGVYYDESEKAFVRLSPTFAKTVSDKVGYLSYHTSGGRIRFATNSKTIAIKCEYPYLTKFSHMPLSGTGGFTLYADYKNGESVYLKTFMPAFTDEKGYEGEYEVPDGIDADGYTLYFPLYNPLSALYIGLDQDAKIEEGLKYSGGKILFYGSSITQGGCASTSANNYVSLLSRRLDMDYLNLGFSGSAKAEKNIVEYLSTIHPSVFVCDYDHNTPNREHLEKTHYPLYETFRKNNPDTPIVLVSKPRANVRNKESDEGRYEVIRNTYERAKKQGDEKVFLVNGKDFFVSGGSHTVDGVHPTDYGFQRMADEIEKAIRNALKCTKSQ